MGALGHTISVLLGVGVNNTLVIVLWTLGQSLRDPSDSQLDWSGRAIGRAFAWHEQTLSSVPKPA